MFFSIDHQSSTNDWLKPVMTTGLVNMHIDQSIANLGGAGGGGGGGAAACCDGYRQFLMFQLFFLLFLDLAESKVYMITYSKNLSYHPEFSAV